MNSLVSSGLGPARRFRASLLFFLIFHSIHIFVDGQVEEVGGDEEGSEYYEEDINCLVYCSCTQIEGRWTTDCSHQGLVTVPVRMPRNSMTLKLNGNHFRDSLNTAGLFAKTGVTSLLEIDLSDSAIINIQEPVFLNLSIIQKIDLSHNSLTELLPRTFLGLSKLKVLDLRENKLVQLGEYSFNGAPLLEDVRLDSNQLRYIYNEAFASSIRIQKVSLIGNRFFNLDVRAFDMLPGLRELHLQQNPFRCDCFLRDFVSWIIPNHLSPPPACQSPDVNRGKSWTQLTPMDFACKPKLPRNLGSNVRGVAGDPLRIDCPLNADPQPKVTWDFEPRPIVLEGGAFATAGPKRPVAMDTMIVAQNGSSIPAMKYSVHVRDHQLKPNTWIFSLQVLNLTSADEGTYFCRAENNAGHVVKGFHLTVIKLSEEEEMKRRRKSWDKSKGGGAQNGGGFSLFWGDHGDIWFICSVIIAALLIATVSLMAIFCYQKGLQDSQMSQGNWSFGGAAFGSDDGGEGMARTCFCCCCCGGRRGRRSHGGDCGKTYGYQVIEGNGQIVATDNAQQQEAVVATTTTNHHQDDFSSLAVMNSAEGKLNNNNNNNSLSTAIRVSGPYVHPVITSYRPASLHHPSTVASSLTATTTATTATTSELANLDSYHRQLPAAAHHSDTNDENWSVVGGGQGGVTRSQRLDGNNDYPVPLSNEASDCGRGGGRRNKLPHIEKIHPTSESSTTTTPSIQKKQQDPIKATISSSVNNDYDHKNTGRLTSLARHENPAAVVVPYTTTKKPRHLVDNMDQQQQQQQFGHHENQSHQGHRKEIAFSDDSIRQQQQQTPPKQSQISLRETTL